MPESKYFIDTSEGSRHQIFPGIEIRTSAGEKMMLSVVEFEPHSIVEEHSHPHEQVGIMLEGELEFFVGDEHQTLGPGQMWRIPGGVKHRVHAGDKKARALDVFTPVRDDYL